MVCLTNLTSRSFLQISPILIPLISEEMSKLYRTSVLLRVFPCFVSLNLSVVGTIAFTEGVIGNRVFFLTTSISNFLGRTYGAG
jgi:hypothetical protein